MNIRKTGSREEMDAQWAAINSLVLAFALSTLGDPGIGNGGTAGNLRTTASVDFRISDREYTKASTDDVWDLTGETDTAAGEYRAYWLLLDASGVGSVEAGSNQTTEALALARLVDLDSTKSVAGVYVAGPSTDFDAGGGLAAQGTVYDGVPDGVNIGVPRQTYTAPELAKLVPA